MLSRRDPAMRRGKNALPADDSWPTFIFPAFGEDIATPFAFSAFLLPPLSRRLEGSLLLNTGELQSKSLHVRLSIAHGQCVDDDDAHVVAEK